MRIEITAPCMSSGVSVDPAEQPHRYIEVRVLGGLQGSQGDIYEVQAIDGPAAVRKLLVKIFPRGFPPPLKEIVRTIHDLGHDAGVMSCPALQALPLFLFEGNVQGTGAVQGYVMRRVAGQSFYQILDSEADTYQELPLISRLRLASRFVDGMAALYNLTLVHADLNGQNLMIDMRSNELAIIDLDGGAIARGGQTPVAIGKPDPGWLAPELRRQWARAKTNQDVVVDIKSDLWSIASGVHYLLFGIGPYFFSYNYDSIPTYLRDYRWPQTRGVTGIRLANPHAFAFHEEAYETVPELHRLFEASFQEGFAKPERRLSAYQWKQGLNQAIAAAGSVGTVTPPKRRSTVTVQGTPPVSIGVPISVQSRSGAVRTSGPSSSQKVVVPVPTTTSASKSQGGLDYRSAIIAGLFILAAFAIIRWLSLSGLPEPTRAQATFTQSVPAVLSLEEQIRQDPGNRELWNRAHMEWRRARPRRLSAAAGAYGIGALLNRQRPSYVGAGDVASALQAVGPLPREFYLTLAAGAESYGDRPLAHALLGTALEYIPGDQVLARRRDLLLKAIHGERGAEDALSDVRTAPTVAPTLSASVIVRTGVARSRVLVDGKYVGTTDGSGMVTFRAAPGTRFVTIQRDGHVDERWEVELTAGETETVTATFHAQPSTLDVVTLRGARIEVDGQAITGSSTRVLPGSHMVTVSAPGFVTATQWVTVLPRQNQKISVQLLKALEASSAGADNAPSLSSADPEPRTNTPSLYKTPESESTGEEAFRGSVEDDAAQAVQSWTRTILDGGELKLAVKHDFRLIRIHRLFNGALTITNRGIVFDAHQDPSDSFSVPWANVKKVKENGLNKRDRAVVALELEVERMKEGRRETRTYKFVSGRGWIDREQDVKCDDCRPLIPATVALIRELRATLAGGGR